MSMTVIAIVVLVVAVAGLLLGMDKGKGKGKDTAKLDTALTYEVQDGLFTDGEKSFLVALEKAVQGQARIYGKVRVADVLRPTQKDKKLWQKSFNQISAKHLDYCLTDNDFRYLCAIELDDKSHSLKKRMERDVMLQDACDSAQFALVRFTARSSYNVEEVRAKLQPLLDKVAARNVVPLSPLKAVK